ncbi:MAG TPA: alpha-N-arabinofuranosidase [Verrucomicrobiae bacterium]|jgi:alpha-N-arabinofuranosidase
MKIPARTAGFILVMSLALLTTNAQVQSVSATIDASKTYPPISKYVYGQFIEHIGGIINNGLWAEMLDDRKFYYPIQSQTEIASGSGRFALRHWNFVGDENSVVMDPNDPYVGGHTPLVNLNGNEPCGIQQSGLAVQSGKSYSGRIVLAGKDAKIAVSLIWGTNANERQTIFIGRLRTDYKKFPLNFTVPADSTNACLEIVGTGKGMFHIGAVSLMPADNVDGFRREVVDALKQLHSGIYRFPGGNYVSGYEWTDAIGDPDKRPPRWDYAWKVMQPNDVGTDEFMKLCKLLEVEPYLTVNAGFGDAHSAADWVEYCNGSATSTMGRWRAANGHPEPYSVKFWAVGNEAWGWAWTLGVTPLDQFEIKNNLFAEAMRRVDPTIKLIASGAMPDTMTSSKQSLLISGKLIPDPLGPADWTGGLFKNCLSNMDLVSEHYYSYAKTHFDLSKSNDVPDDPNEPLVDWMRRPANHVRTKYEDYQDYLEEIPALKTKPVPICLDEWAYARVPANSYKVVPAYAWAFHEMFRHSGLYQMACFTFATSLVSANRNEAVLNPAGLLFKMYRDHFGVIPVEVSGNSAQPKPKYPPGGEDPKVNAGSDTFPLDVAAAWTEDKKYLAVAVINPTETTQEMKLSIQGAGLIGGGKLWRLAPSNLDATIVVGQEPGVQVEEQTVDSIPITPAFAPYSVTIYNFPVK